MTNSMTQQLPSSTRVPSSGSEELLRELLPEISELQRALTQLISAAYEDQLTRLLNGAALRRFEDVKERTHAFGAVFVDLTGFKGINDGHGHEAGDAALREVGSVLVKIAQEYGAYVFRKSGDEFVLLARKVSGVRDCALAIAHRLARGVPFKYGSLDLHLKGAVGYSLREDDESTLSALIRQADAGCAIAKERGGSEAVQWTPELERDVAISERRRCSCCQATTSLLVRAARRAPTALQRCANCGEPLA